MRGKWSRHALWIIALAVAAALTAYFGYDRPYQEAYTPDNLIRLHVMANSDRPEDQALKYAVRDVILRELAPRLAPVDRVAVAQAVIREERARLEESANAYLASRGAPYRARVEIGSFPFPTRSYYNLVLPAGQYQAVRVVLGEGEGQNWWCVLFPPLCFVDIAASGSPPAAEAVAATARPGVKEADRPPIVTRLRLLEALQQSQRRLARLWSGS